MSKSLNSVQLLGRLGKDPDMKTTDSGMQITTCSIATSRNVKNKATGKYDTELTDWHRVVFFDKLAGIVAQYLKKGSLTHITGRIQTRSWNENGVTKYITEIVANNMIMLDGKQDNAGGGSSYTQKPEPEPEQYKSKQETNDDVPF